MMQKIGFIVFFIFIFFPTRTISQGDSNLPLKKCWENYLPDFNPNLVASDNADIFISNQNFIKSFTLFGELIWNLKIDGEIILKLLKEKESEFIFIISRQESNQNQVLVRVASTKTGIVNYISEFTLPSNLIADESLTIEKTGNSILFWNLNNFIKLDLPTNQTKPITLPKDFSKMFLIGNQLWIINKENTLFISQPDTDNIFTKFSKLPFLPNTLNAINSTSILISNKIGDIVLFGLDKKKVLWKTKVGAELTQIEVLPDSIIISSNDNFIYKFSLLNGKKIWKRKLLTRNTFVLPNNRNLFFSVDLGEKFAYGIELSNGKVVNQLEIEDGNYFVGKPLNTEDFLIFSTNKGLVSYTLGQCKKAE